LGPPPLLKENKYSEAYDIAKKNLNISVLNEIILYLLIEKKYEEACEMSEKALMEVEKKHGSNSLKIVPILSSYGTALYYNSKNRECYKKVLEIYKRRLNILILYKGNNHQDVADALHGLAQLYIEFNNPKKASKCYEKAMEIFMLHKDNQNIHISKFYQDYASFCESQNEILKACNMYERTLTEIEKMHGKYDKEFVLPTIQKLEYLFAKVGNEKKVKEYNDRRRDIIAIWDKK
jgi:tetratricopeptide (TPR) repeat protein